LLENRHLRERREVGSTKWVLSKPDASVPEANTSDVDKYLCEKRVCPDGGNSFPQPLIFNPRLAEPFYYLILLETRGGETVGKGVSRG